VTPTVKQHKCKIEIKISIFWPVAENCELLHAQNILPLKKTGLIFETLFPNQAAKVSSLKILFVFSESSDIYFSKTESISESIMLYF
jgi:hypothetical protein